MAFALGSLFCSAELIDLNLLFPILTQLCTWTNLWQGARAMSSVPRIAALLSSWAFFFSLSTLSVWGQTDEQARLVEGAKSSEKFRTIDVKTHQRDTECAEY